MNRRTIAKILCAMPFCGFPLEKESGAYTEAVKRIIYPTRKAAKEMRELSIALASVLPIAAQAGVTEEECISLLEELRDTPEAYGVEHIK